MATSILGQTAVRAAKLEVVTELPEIGKKNQIYLVPNKSSVSGDVYDEYIWINNTWEFLGNKRLELTIDSILKPYSTNPVENGAIYSRFLGVDKDIEVNKNNIGVLTGRVNEIDGIAKGAEELTKVNEKRINSIEALAKANEAKSQDNASKIYTLNYNVADVKNTADGNKHDIESLTNRTVKPLESKVSQLQELNVVYPNNIRNLTTKSTVAEVMEAFVPAIGGSAGKVNTPHVGYLIKGAAHRDSPEDIWKSDPDSTIISVEIVKIDNKDCHKFMYIDNNRDLVTMTVCIWGETFKVIERSVVSNINTIVDKINTFDKKLSSGTLRDLYISAGAKYNEATGYYELNGLTDITEEEMRVIYKYAGTPQVRGAFAYSKARTNLLMSGMYNGWLCEDMFYGCTNLEVAYLGNKQSSPTAFDIPSAYMEGFNCFYLCSKLKKIYGKIYQRNNNWSLTFGECHALKEVRIAELYSSIMLSWSPNLSKESVLYMITNANPPRGAAVGSITITLHPTAYARLKDDADIVAALEAKGGIITLVST